jgi:hypothetical protein
VAKKKKRKGRKTGFFSKKQWKWAFANKKEFAHRMAHRTKGGKKIRYRRLPESKHSGKKGRR